MIGLVHERIRAKLCRMIENLSDDLDSFAVAHAQWPQDVRSEIIESLIRPALGRMVERLGTTAALDGYLIGRLGSIGKPGIFITTNILCIRRAHNDSPISLDLAGRSLRGADFRGALLWKSDLTGCHLNEVAFSDAIGSICSVSRQGADGEPIAIGLASGAVELRTAEGEQLLARSTRLHTQAVRFVHHVAATQTIISGSEDGRVVEWKYRSRSSELLYSHDSWVWDGSIHDCLLATIASDATVHIYDLTAHRHIAQLSLPADRYWCVQWFKGFLLVAGESGKLLVTTELVVDEARVCTKPEVVTWRSVWASKAPIKALAVHEQKIALGLANGCIQFLRLNGGEAGDVRDVHSLAGGTVRSVEWLSESTLASAGDDGVVRITEDTTDGAKTMSLSACHSRIWQLRRRATAAGSFTTVGDDRAIRIWDAKRSRFPIAVRSGYGLSIRTLDALGGRVAYTGNDDFIRLLSEGTLQMQRVSVVKRHSRIVGAYFTHADTMLATLDTGELAIISNISASPLIDPNEWRRAHLGPIECLVPSGRRDLFLTGGEDRRGCVWRYDGTLTAELKGHHTSRIWTGCFSDDQSVVVTAGGDFSLGWWDCGNGSLIQTSVGHASLVFAVAYSVTGHLVSADSSGLLLTWAGKEVVAKQSLKDLLRFFLRTPNGLIGVGRSLKAEEGWSLLVIASDGAIKQRYVYPKMHGSARAAIILANGNVLVGGDGTQLLVVNVMDGRILKEVNTIGPYEGTKVSKVQSFMDPLALRSIELLGARLI